MANIAETDPRVERTFVYRHSLATRLTHWINVFCLTILLLSGLQIFNAHPMLYWGQYGADNDTPFISISAVQDGDSYRGVTMIGGLSVSTTGVLGVSTVAGELTP